MTGRRCGICLCFLESDEKTYCQDCRGVLANIAGIFGKGKRQVHEEKDAEHEERVKAHCERIGRELEQKKLSVEQGATDDQTDLQHLPCGAVRG